jgi:hypothetical protein
MRVGDQHHAPAALPPVKVPVPILQEENGWAPGGPVWTGGYCNITFRLSVLARCDNHNICIPIMNYANPCKTQQSEYTAVGET